MNNNEKLEQLLDEVKKNPEQGFGEGFSELLEQTVFMVPAILPPDTDSEVVKKIFEEAGKDKVLPEGVNPRPCLLENPDGDKFLPIFTSPKQLEGGPKAPEFPLTLNVPFPDCIEMLKGNAFVKGAVINPYVHNVVVPVNIEKPKQEAERRQEVKKPITMDEYHVLMRQAFESHILPKHLFEEKGECASRLSKEKGAYIRELFEEAYADEYACPYMEDEFDFLPMQISDDLLVVQISMPSKYGKRNTASSIVFGWDTKQEKIWYYALVKGPGNGRGVLVEKFQDGSMQKHGEVEGESGLLYTLVQKIQGEEA